MSPNRQGMFSIVVKLKKPMNRNRIKSHSRSLPKKKSPFSPKFRQKQRRTAIQIW
jgi:hypothetical protein